MFLLCLLCGCVCLLVILELNRFVGVVEVLFVMGEVILSKGRSFRYHLDCFNSMFLEC